MLKVCCSSSCKCCVSAGTVSLCSVTAQPKVLETLVNKLLLSLGTVLCP